VLSDLLYKWHGIDKWPEVTATVTSTGIDWMSVRFNSRSMSISFTYQPMHTADESGKVYVDEYSSIYGMAENDTFQIKYDPDHPFHYYCKEANTLLSNLRFAQIAFFAVLIAIALVDQLLRHIKR
jgi:hypothetical protein